jgi:hypothetical protein
MKTQRIETGTPEGDALGFCENLFSGWLELKTGSRLYLHYIISRCRGNGNTQALIRSWLERGYDVRVVMPRPVMQYILRKFGFIPLHEYLPDQYADPVEVWYRPSSRAVARHGPRCPPWPAPNSGRPSQAGRTPAGIQAGLEHAPY